MFSFFLVNSSVTGGISSVSNTPSPPTSWSESYECYWYLLLDYLFIGAFAIFSAVNLDQVLLAGPRDLLHDSKAHFQNITEFCYLVVRLANSLVRESRVCICKIFCIHKEDYHPL